MHEYRCEIVKIVDGDTIDVAVDLGFDTWVCGSGGRIRLYGVDTPESRTRDKKEKQYGLAAKSFVEQFFEGAEEIVLKTWEKGKFGRYLGDFQVKNKWLCAELLANHHAVKYIGQNKSLIKAAHIKNRKLVELD
jgi:micrococcal nuclease